MANRALKAFDQESLGMNFAKSIDRYVDGMVDAINRKKFKSVEVEHPVKHIYFSMVVEGYDDVFFLLQVFNPEHGSWIGQYKLFLNTSPDIFHAANDASDLSFIHTCFEHEPDGDRNYWMDITSRFEDDEFFEFIDKYEEKN